MFAPSQPLVGIPGSTEPDHTATKDVPHTISEQSSRYQRIRRLSINTWLLEWLAICVSISTLVAIAVILAVYDGKSLRHWSHTIQLNTVLSTLATTMKGFMLLAVCACLGQWKWLWYTGDSRSLTHFDLLDAASRGPLGSLQLLSSLKLRAIHVASLGGVVVLLALLSDVFVQQSVSYPLRATNTSVSAGIPYASALENSAMHHDVDEISPKLRLAVYDGIFSHNLTSTSSSIIPVCPTGNCTFPAYASLAVCSHCANVSSLVVNSTKQSGDYDYNYNFTTPNGLNINGDSAQGVWSPIVMTTQLTELNSKALDRWLYNQGILVTSIMMWKGPGYEVEAADCALTYCAKEYTSRIHQGKFVEDVTAVIEPPVWNDQFNAINPDLVPYIHFNVSREQMPSLAPDFNRTFSLGSKIDYHLRLQFETYFTTSTGMSDTGLISFESDVDSGFYWNGPHAISTTMSNIADAITNAIRGLSDQRYQGTASSMESYIHVSWLWLLLPLIMLILAVIFLVLTARRCRVDGVPHWRTSALAVMEHGVTSAHLGELKDWETRDLKEPFESVSGKEETSVLDDWAEKVRVRLRRRGENGEGFGLVYA